MTPVKFPEANTVFGRPRDMAESQCHSVDAFCGEIASGSLDGDTVVVVAWQPTPEDLKRLNAGHPVFLSCIGGLVPHFLCTSFADAVNVA